MGRLIDADILLAKVVEANPMGGMIGGKFIKDLVKTEPTTYDVDKVVKQLKECERYIYDAVSDEDNYVIDTEKAIEIVKGAVKDE